LPPNLISPHKDKQMKIKHHEFPCSDDSKLKAAARMSLLRKSLKKAKQKEQNDNLVNNENDANISLEPGKDFNFNS